MAKKLIIAGASGMVGGIVLREALSDTNVAEVTSLVRRPSGISHPKLKEVIHSDFSDLSDVLEAFEDKDLAFFCIGVYTGVVPDDAFRIITVDQAVSYGNALKEKSPQGRLCFLSGQGADRKEKSRMSFARYKGMAENHLLVIGLGDLYIFRPGYIYPVEKRDEPNFSYRLMRSVYPFLGRFLPHVTSEELGKAMLQVGMEGHSIDTLENSDIRKVI